MNSEIAIFAAGCFWCYEPIFEKLRGVESVEPGYIGGKVDDLDYYQVTSGKTGHAEAVRVVFDPSKVSYDQLLEVFWHIHDPTQLNKQGYDVGTQYRSEIFYTTPQQEDIARKSLQKIKEAGEFENEVVTKISEAGKFFPAEDYHHKFYERNRRNPYCQLIIDPKLEKFQKNYQYLIKKD